MLTCCTSNPYKDNLCKQCFKKSRYHCTWPNCVRPVFTLTLCRNHYRHINVTCAWPECNRPTYCRQICAHHYRKREFVSKIECGQCERPVYMHNKCFYHFTCRTCTKCTRKVFSKQLCRRHYMREWRAQRSLVKGPTTNNETRPAATQETPEIIIHMPEIQSSLTQSAIYE